MEIITIPGYLDDEKFYIAKGHLIPKLINEAGLKDGIFRISDKAIYKVIHSYTKESGVRELERRLGKLVRLTAHNWVNRKKKTYIQEKTLEKHLGPKVYTAREGERSLPPGVVYGLAWTETGGEILRIEVLTVPGKGKLTLTGQLGDVLKESAYAALSYIRSRSQRFKLNTDFYEKFDIHLHIPEGSIPKDGPSAGASIVCALVSALTGHRASSDIAITGEITLTGEVLKIGGLQEKIGAAKRGKLKQIIVPQENMGEVKRIRKTLKEGILFHYVKHIDEIIDIIFPRIFISRFPKEERAIASS